MLLPSEVADMNDIQRQELKKVRNALASEIERIDALLANGEKDLFGHETDKAPPPTYKTPPGLLKIRRIFGHRDTTLPDDKQRRAYNALARRVGDKDTFYEQVEIMERFYKYRSKRSHNEPDLWSHDATTLLNNWDAKEATARDFLKGKPTSSPAAAIKDTIPEPVWDWRAVAKEEYANNKDWDETTWKYLDQYPEVQNHIIKKGIQ